MHLSSLERLYASYRRRGDARALARIFDRTAGELLRVATYLAGDPDRAEDLVQGVFLTLLETDRYQEGRPLLPWMLGVLAHKAMEQRRRFRRRPDASRLRTEQLRDPVADLCRGEFVADLQGAIDGLPAPYGQVMRLYLLHGLGSAEIGRVLERAPGTVRTQVVRGMEMLRRSLPKDHATAGAFPLAPLSSLGPLRDELLRRTGARPVVGTGVLMGGAVLMKKSILWGCAAALCASLIGLALHELSVPGGLPEIGAPPPGGPLTVSLAVGGAERNGTERAPAAGAAEREPIEGVRHGSLRLEVVFADGTPAADLGLTLGWNGGPVVQERTDEEGVLHLEEVIPGPVQILLDRSREQHSAEVQAGEETRTRIVVPRGILLVGRVRGPDHRPVPGPSVWGAANDLAPVPVLLAGCDDEGWFSIRDAATALRIWARAPGFTPSQPMMHYGTAGARVEVDLVLGRAAGAITGRVVDDRGLAVQRALLGIALDVDADGGGEPVLVLNSGPDGSFTSDEVPYGSHVLAGRSGSSTGWMAFHNDADSTPPLVLRLLPGARIHGRVLDGRGAPLSGTRVSVRAQDPDLPRSLFEMTAAAVTSQPDGSYALEGLMTGRHLVIAEHGGQRAEIDAGLGRSDLRWDPVFPSQGQLRVQVVDAGGRPLSGWKVAIGTDEQGQVASGTTDAAGRHRAEKLEYQEYTVSVHAPLTESPPTDWSPFPALVERGVLTGEGEIRLQLPEDARPSVFVSGRTVDLQGQPLGNAWVQLMQEGWDIQQSDYADVETGSFRIGPLSPGVYSLAVMPEGYPARYIDGRRLHAGEEWDLGELRFEPPALLSVVPAHAGTSLRAWLQGPGRRVSGSVAGGSLIFSPCPPGTYELHVIGADIEPVTRTVELAAGERALEIDPVSAPTVTLEIAHPDHLRRRTAANLDIQVFAGNGLLFRELLRAAMTDREQRILRLPIGLAPGRYRIVATDRDFSWTAETRVRIPGDTVVHLDLR